MSDTVIHHRVFSMSSIESFFPLPSNQHIRMNTMSAAPHHNMVSKAAFHGRSANWIRVGSSYPNLQRGFVPSSSSSSGAPVRATSVLSSGASQSGGQQASHQATSTADLYRWTSRSYASSSGSNGAGPPGGNGGESGSGDASSIFDSGAARSDPMERAYSYLRAPPSRRNRKANPVRPLGARPSKADCAHR